MIYHRMSSDMEKQVDNGLLISVKIIQNYSNKYISNQSLTNLTKITITKLTTIIIMIIIDIIRFRK